LETGTGVDGEVRCTAVRHRLRRIGNNTAAAAGAGSDRVGYKYAGGLWFYGRGLQTAYVILSNAIERIPVARSARENSGGLCGVHQPRGVRSAIGGDVDVVEVHA